MSFYPRMSNMDGMDDMSSTSSNMTMGKMYLHGTIGDDMLWFQSWMPTSAGAIVGVCIGLFIFAIFERYLAAFRRACDAGWRKGLIGFSVPTSSGPHSASPSSPAPVDRRSSTFKPYAALPDSSLPNTPAAFPAPEYSLSGPSPSGPSGNSSDTTSTDELGPGGLGSGSGAGSVDREKIAGQVVEQPSHSHLPRAVRRTLDPAREGRWSRPFRWSVDIPRGCLHALQTMIHYLLMLVVMTFNIWWIISVVVGAGVGEAMFGRFGSSHHGH
ncbi:hypothetical protein EHS25_000293 [Saitozyma podzolica]|uniref:Copper transport protein n=1 Tax=Saitozyma podzolica TaxID=1890683 RepID=A0A427YVT6_9TREE|nr:hypothetical protein EHS25_000293 [Saitozyma podzolica]